MTKAPVIPAKGADIPRQIPVVLVTPDQAAQWLATRFDNERPIRRNKVKSFARDMRQDNWHWIGDPIRFSNDKDQRLVDGQHRLTAVVESGRAQWFPVLNIPTEARAGIDTGTSRTLGDLLGFGGHIKGRELAAIVRRLLVYREGLQGTSGGTYVPTHSEGMEFTEKHEEDLRDATNVAERMHRSGLGISPSAFGAAYFCCAKVNKQEADDLFERMVTGAGLEVGDPGLAYRTRALKWQAKYNAPMPPDDVFRFAILVWNMVRRGQRIERLQTPKGGWTKDNVPVPE